MPLALVPQPDEVRTAGKARVERRCLGLGAQAVRVPLVDQRAPREVVRGLGVVLALEREQPAADDASLVGADAGRLRRHGLRLLGLAAHQRQEDRREEDRSHIGRVRLEAWI